MVKHSLTDKNSEKKLPQAILVRMYTVQAFSKIISKVEAKDVLPDINACRPLKGPKNVIFVPGD